MPKTVLFRLLVEAALVLWLPLLWADKSYRPRWSALNASAVIFFGVLVLTSLTGVDFGKSLWSDYERMMGLWTFGHLLVFFLILGSVVRSRGEWQRLLYASLGTSVFISIYGIIEGLGGSGRIISTIGNAAFLAAYILPHIFVGLFLLLDERRFSARSWLLGAGLILMLWALVLTGARASFVGLAAGGVLLILAFLVWRTREGSATPVSRRALKRIFFSMLIVLAMGVAGLMLFRPYVSPYVPQPLGRLLLLDRGDRTASGRLMAWRVSWEGWKERLLLGWGPENYNILFNTHYDAHLVDQEPWFDRAHNFIFDIGGTSGLVGLLAYVILIGSAVRSLFLLSVAGALPFWTAAGVGAFLGAYLTQNLFTFDTITSAMIFFLLLAFIASPERREYGSPATPVRNAFPWAGVVGIGVPLLLFAYWINVRPFLESRAGRAGWDQLRLMEEDTEALTSFEQGLAYHTRGDVDLKRFFAEYVFEFLKQGGHRSDDSLKRIMAGASEKMEENITAEPKNVKWLMYQGELYNLMAARFNPSYARTAEEYFSRARALSPQRPQIYLELAQARKVQGDITGMWMAIDELFKLLPGYVVGHVNAASLAIDLGDAAREKTEVEWLESRSLAIDLLRDAYARNKRYDRAVHFQELYVAEFNSVATPELATRYAQLAALYHLTGDDAKAREAAMRVGEIDPSRMAEVKAFLQTLQN